MTKKPNKKNNVSYFIKHRLQQLRTKINLSEEEAAIKTGFPLKEYLAIEKGSKRISLEILAQLAVSFEVDAHELLPSMLDSKKIHNKK